MINARTSADEVIEVMERNCFRHALLVDPPHRVGRDHELIGDLAD